MDTKKIMDVLGKVLIVVAGVMVANRVEGMLASRKSSAPSEA
jgi:hypothetical protein